MALHDFRKHGRRIFKLTNPLEIVYDFRLAAGWWYAVCQTIEDDGEILVRSVTLGGTAGPELKRFANFFLHWKTYQEPSHILFSYSLEKRTNLDITAMVYSGGKFVTGYSIFEYTDEKGECYGLDDDGNMNLPEFVDRAALQNVQGRPLFYPAPKPKV